MPDRRRPCSALLALTVSGCLGVGAPEIEGLIDAEGGARLRASYWKSGRRKVLFRGWFDEALAMDCTFQPTPDGKLRCLPVGDANRISPVFADARCSERVVEGPAPQELLWAEASSGCPRALVAFRRGRRIETRLIHVRNNGTCNPRETTEEVHALEEITDATVAADIFLTGAPGGLAREVAQTADGARALVGWRDLALRVPCSFPLLASGDLALAADGRPRCLPTGGAQVQRGVHADAACSRPTARSLPTACLETEIAADPVERTCPPRTAFFRTGARVERGFVATDAGCAADPAPRPGGAPLRELGSEIPAGELPAGELRRGEVGRLRPLAVATAAGAERLGAAWDNELEAACIPLVAPDGEVRCVPLTHADLLPTAFADPQCRRRIAAAREPKACAARYALEWQAPRRPARLFAVDSAWTGAVYVMAAEGCRPSQGFEGPLYVLGREIPLADLPRLD